ncbi:hypothetical protein [Melittangium boletus]|nr:hypothetical protein [Melittangium boletus]
MANQKDDKQPREQEEETRKAGTDSPDESHEGKQGYGQPPKEVGDKPLPDQKWGGK